MSNVIAMLKQGGTVLLGIAVLAGIVLFVGAMFAGVAVATEFLYPIIQVLAGISFLIFLFIVLPLSIFQPLRVSMAITSMILSYVCGVSVWMYSFLVIMLYLKWLALFALMFFQAVAPLACIVLLFNGGVAAAGGVVLGLVITYGMRFYAIWLESIYQKREEAKFEIKAMRSTDLVGKIVAGSKICPACCEKNNPSFTNCWKCETPLALRSEQ